MKVHASEYENRLRNIRSEILKSLELLTNGNNETIEFSKAINPLEFETSKLNPSCYIISYAGIEGEGYLHTIMSGSTTYHSMNKFTERDLTKILETVQYEVLHEKEIDTRGK